MYSIVDVDMNEWEAYLCILGDETRHWFNFNGFEYPEGPTLAAAIKFFKENPYSGSADALKSLDRVGLL